MHLGPGEKYVGLNVSFVFAQHMSNLGADVFFIKGPENK